MNRPYAIGAAAKLTGLSADTIRAWERRYGVVAPQRDGKGKRRYGDADVERLKLLRSATSVGHSIGQVAKLRDEVIRALVQQTSKANDYADSPVVRRVLESIRRYDVWRAEELLAEAAAALAPQRFALTVLTPLMSMVGSLWEQRVLSIAQEHLVSVLVRNLLGALMRQRPAAGSGRMLFVTPPGEQHEFGILLAAALASLQGVGAAVLGTGVPATETLRAARFISPDIIVVGATLAQSEVERYALALRSKLPARTQLWIGGAGTASASTPRGTLHIASLELFCRQLNGELP